MTRPDNQPEHAPAAATSPFEIYTPADVRALIETCPLAWVCSASGREASLLPLVGVFDEEDALVELIGHFGRANPLHAALLADRRATILFKGPDAYIDPSMAGKRDWGPTWNYAQAQIEADITIDADLTAEALDRLIAHVERARDRPWSADELGDRYDSLVRHIIGFRARVTKVRARFKLGQDEAVATLHHILDTMPDAELARWMRRFNAKRLGDGLQGD